MPPTPSLSFFRAWTARPLQVAAVAPSGRALAALITAGISRSTGPVLELGAGTGAFTDALLERGVAEEMLTLVECESAFAVLLKQRFPAARVRRIDAASLKTARLFAAPIVGAVVSGLPLLTMPAFRVRAILDGAFAVLVPGGAFYQFTYMPFSPVRRAMLDRLDLEATCIGRTVRNLPPAAVYRIARRGSAA